MSCTSLCTSLQTGSWLRGTARLQSALLQNTRLNNIWRRALCSAAIISLALGSAPASADEIRLQDNAPGRYVVVQGDTLWGISGKFLKDPWRWPDIWKLNKAEIRDPHWIFPGDVIILDTVDGQPSLRLLGNAQNDGLRRQIKLEPRIRFSPKPRQAAPTIPTAVIEPFLNRPLIVDEQEFKDAPRIALGPDDKLVMSPGDRAYAVGLDSDAGETMQSFRGDKPVVDPVTKEVLGYEVTYTGELVVLETGDVSTLRVTKAGQEIRIGDRLLPRPSREYPNYVPRTPQWEVEGQVLSSLGGVKDIGPYATVLVNLGERDNMELGHLLHIFRAPREVKKESRNEPTLLTPPNKIGNLFIYRVFPKLAYGLVLDSIVPVNPGDLVRKP